MSVRTGKIPVQAAANVATPEDASFVFLYIDSTSSKLSWKNSAAAVVTITSA